MLTLEDVERLASEAWARRPDHHHAIEVYQAADGSATFRVDVHTYAVYVVDELNVPIPPEFVKPPHRVVKRWKVLARDTRNVAEGTRHEQHFGFEQSAKEHHAKASELMFDAELHEYEAYQVPRKPLRGGRIKHVYFDGDDDPAKVEKVVDAAVGLLVDMMANTLDPINRHPDPKAHAAIDRNDIPLAHKHGDSWRLTLRRPA